MGDTKRFVYKGYQCAIIFQDWHEDRKYYCGYVGLLPGTRFYKVSYDNIPVDCYCGLTYGDLYGYRKQWPKNPDIDDDEIYWIGFDTDHGYSEEVSFDDMVTILHNMVDQLIELEKIKPYEVYKMENRKVSIGNINTFINYHYNPDEYGPEYGNYTVEIQMLDDSRIIRHEELVTDNLFVSEDTKFNKEA